MTKYRVFKVSINIPFYHIYSDSKIHKIKSFGDLIIPVFSYSLVTILFGYFGSKIVRSIEALHINFTGGEDYSNEMMENDFDESTNFVWRNLKRDTSEKIDRKGVKVLLDLQEKYIDNNEDSFSPNNLYTLKSELSRMGYSNIQETDIEDFFDALKIFADLKE